MYLKRAYDKTTDSIKSENDRRQKSMYRVEGDIFDDCIFELT